MRFLSAELRWVRKLVNPPYSVIDIFTVVGLVFILLTIPVITLNVSKTRDPASRAATTCAANLSYEVIGIGSSNTLKVNPGQNVSVKATGLSGCTNSDKVMVRLWGFDNAPWQGWKDQKQCQLGSRSTSCTMTFPAPNSPGVGYPIQVTFDKGADGKNDAWTGWPKWLGVNKVAASCTSKPTLSMSKTSGIEIGETVTATIGGFSNCSGADRFTVQTQAASTANWTSRGSFKPSGSTKSYPLKFSINQKGNYQVRVAFDQGSNGSIESYSSSVQIQVIEKVVVKKCSGTLNYTVNNKSSGTVNVNVGSGVTSKGTGLSNCTSSDKLYIQYWDSNNNNLPSSNKWRNSGLYCNLSTSGSCSKQWTPSAKMPVGSWATRMILNYSGNGTGSYIHNSGWVYVNIQQVSTSPPPSAAPCSGSPKLSLSQNSVTANSGATITATSRGFSNCGNSDRQWIWLRPVTESWKGSHNIGSCTFANSSTECSFSFAQPNTVVRYQVAVTWDGPNGTLSDFEYLDVITPPPTSDPPPSGGSQDEIKNYIKAYVGQNSQVAVSGGGYYQVVNIGQFLYGLAGCESRWTPSAYAGAPYYEKGLYQYQAKNISGYSNSTFDTWGSAVNATGGTLGTDIWNYQHQVKITNWKVRASSGSDVDAWACYTGGGWLSFIAGW